MWRNGTALLLALAGIAGWILVLPASGIADATYVVKLCQNGTTHDGITLNSETSGGLKNVDECGGPIRNFEGIRQQAFGSSAKGRVEWRLQAPAGTTIGTLDGERSGGVWDTQELLWIASNGRLPFLEKIESTVPGKSVHYDVNSTLFIATFQCTSGVVPCTPPPNRNLTSSVSLTRMTATMVDKVAPSVSIDDPSVGANALQGTVQIPFTATDEGAGVREVGLLVDGAQQSSVKDSDAKCAAPTFQYLTPCALQLNDSFSLDTTHLSDGAHAVKLSAIDGSGQVGEASTTVTVQNAPSSKERPTLTGQAKLGATLTATTGQWDGLRPTLAIQWLRCEAAVKDGEEQGCTPIAGATQDHYALTAADVGRREVLKVTATNASGSASALSPPSGVVAEAPQGGGGGPGKGGTPSGGSGPGTTPPSLSGVSLSRSRFKVRTAHARSGGRADRGTVIRFSSSEPAKLSIAVSRAKSASKPLGTLTREIGPGAGHIAFWGRVHGKALRPGRYKLTLTAIDAAERASQSVVLTFRILPG